MDSIFEAIERSRVIDRVLPWLAMLTTLTAAGAVALFHDKAFVQAHRRFWVWFALSAPLLLFAWKGFNGVLDRFGLDSVAGAIVAFGMMFALGTVVVLADILLEHYLDRPPEEQNAKSQNGG